jgi:hypothetical protein
MLTVVAIQAVANHIPAGIVAVTMTTTTVGLTESIFQALTLLVMIAGQTVTTFGYAQVVFTNAVKCIAINKVSAGIDRAALAVAIIHIFSNAILTVLALVKVFAIAADGSLAVIA